MTRRKRSFLHQHSLSLTVVAILVFLLAMYSRADPDTHLGAFYGNAIADWLGTLVFVVATKYFFEVGSRESRRPRTRAHERLAAFLQRHSLTIVLAATGVVWVALFARMAPNSKTGQVVGNIVSEWTQVLGLVIITKYFHEAGSKEG